MPDCPHCRKKVSEESKICGHCGERLRKSDEDLDRQETTGSFKEDEAESGPGSDEEKTGVARRKLVKKMQKRCAFCDGTGKDPNSTGFPPKPCPVCPNSRGYNFIPEDYLPCLECGGSGKRRVYRGGIESTIEAYRPDPECRGTGWAPK